MSAEREVSLLWRAKAANDLLDADNNLAARETPCDTVCYHCQQAAEKLFKAFLAARGVPPPHSHDLLMLLELVLPLEPRAEGLRNDLAVLTPYAVAARYPDCDAGQPTLDDAREARQCAERVHQWLATVLPASK